MDILPTEAVSKANYRARVTGPGVIGLDTNEVLTNDNAVLVRQLDQLKQLKARSSPSKK